MKSVEIFVKRQETSEPSDDLSASNNKNQLIFPSPVQEGLIQTFHCVICCSLAKLCFTLLLYKIAKLKLCTQDSFRVVINACIVCINNELELRLWY